jgi:hypothetical protein
MLVLLPTLSWSPAMPLHSLALPTLVVIILAIGWMVVAFLMGAGDAGARGQFQ